MVSVQHSKVMLGHPSYQNASGGAGLNHSFFKYGFEAKIRPKVMEAYDSNKCSCFPTA